MKKVLLFVVILFCLGFISGCDDDPKRFAEFWLPKEAKEVKLLGNGWAYFELDDIQYLFYKESKTFIAVPSKK